MTGDLAVLWTIGTELHTGQLKVIRDRVEIRSRRHTLRIPLESIVRTSIDRGPAVRIRGLPVLRVQLVGGLSVKIASLETVTALTDLVGRLGEPVAY